MKLGVLCDECAPPVIPFIPELVLPDEPVRPFTLEMIIMPRYARGSKEWEEALERCMRLQRKSYYSREFAEKIASRPSLGPPQYVYECVCGGFHVTERRQEAEE